MEKATGGEKRSYPSNALRVCVDRMEQNDLEGRVYSRLREEPLTFENCSELFLKADSMFDEKGYPQTFQKKRTFTDDHAYASYCAAPPDKMDSAFILEQTGACDTFDVIVQTRQRTGWQGLLKNSDGAVVAEFQSEMELLKLIIEHIQAAQ